LLAADALTTLGDDTLIVDPDSRLTQLGLYPVAPDYRYFFFDSRGVEGPATRGPRRERDGGIFIADEHRLANEIRDLGEECLVGHVDGIDGVRHC